MKKPLIDVIFASEKRTGMLLLLRDGPMEMAMILEMLGATRAALLPQAKILQEHYLISRTKDTYLLTTLGKIIVGKMLPLKENVDIFDTDIDYWGTRQIDSLPLSILKNINQLGAYQIVTPSATEMFEDDNEFYKASKTSKTLCSVTTFLHPNFYDIQSDLISRNVKVCFILSPDLFNELRTNHYLDFKNWVNNKSFSFFIYPQEIGFLSLSYNDHYTKLRLKRSDGGFDSTYILCSGPSALEWGKEIFEHYLKDAAPITDV
ncbi:helix-turn-helix transcriptional regulator [Methanomethylovorans sp.]|uniref:helix-turn-helix transcriptional regulator n=1 Tax=Methanomethylovorans sp. TaxID=2758717 RepID=UPI00351C7D65